MSILRNTTLNEAFFYRYMQYFTEMSIISPIWWSRGLELGVEIRGDVASSQCIFVGQRGVSIDYHWAFALIFLSVPIVNPTSTFYIT